MRARAIVLFLGLAWATAGTAQTADARRARVEALVARGTRYLDAGDPGSAVGFFVDALRIDPRHETAYLRLTNAHRRRGRNDDALAALELALRMRPRSIALRLARADLLVEVGRPREGLDDLRSATRLDPSSPRAWCARAELARGVGAYAEALNAYRRLLAMPEGARVCEDAGGYARALAGLAVDTDPLARACGGRREASAVEHALCRLRQPPHPASSHRAAPSVDP